MPQGINSGTRIFSTFWVPDFRCIPLVASSSEFEHLDQRVEST